MAKKSDKTEDQIQVIEEALSKSEQFIENNQKNLMGIVAVVVLVIAGYFGYVKFYAEPLEDEAKEQMFMAQRYYEQDSLYLAMNGDGNYIGFIDVLDEYSGTKAGNLASYYLGMCYLKIGEFENAIDNLEDFNANDQIISPMALGAIGDAYLELDDSESAASYYVKASEKSDNDFTTPLYLMRAGNVYEIMGDPKSALVVYNKIKEDYISSFEYREIEKYIARAESKLN